MRELGDKKEMVAHWEQQISEIIHWYVIKNIEAKLEFPCVENSNRKLW